jgi:plastocyanin
MKFIFSILTALMLLIPQSVSALDVTMGSNMNLVFEPNDITINAGDTIRFVNDALPPHNVIIEDHPELTHDGLAFASGESFEITFPDAGDYNFWCDPHKGAGMTGTIHVK